MAKVWRVIFLDSFRASGACARKARFGACPEEDPKTRNISIFTAADMEARLFGRWPDTSVKTSKNEARMHLRPVGYGPYARLNIT